MRTAASRSLDKTGGQACCCPAGMGADALRVTCEGTRGLPTATGGTITLDLFTIALTIFGFLMMVVAIGILVFAIFSINVPDDKVLHQNTSQQ